MSDADGRPDEIAASASKGAVINYDREGGESIAAGVWNFSNKIVGV